jgi:hypothetical protein
MTTTVIRSGRSLGRMKVYDIPPAHGMNKYPDGEEPVLHIHNHVDDPDEPDEPREDECHTVMDPNPISGKVQAGKMPCPHFGGTGVVAAGDQEEEPDQTEQQTSAPGYDHMYSRSHVQERRALQSLNARNAELRHQKASDESKQTVSCAAAMSSPSRSRMLLQMDTQLNAQRCVKRRPGSLLGSN